MGKWNIKFVLLGVAILIIVVLVVIFGFRKDKDISLKGGDDVQKVAASYIPYNAPENASPITGLACDNYKKRPFAIMYSGSTDARQYWHNLSKADFVLEMPHRPMHNEPRLLGVFQCETPDALGPMRSGRIDHIGVANSLDAVYITWGRSSTAGALLNRGVNDFLEVGNGSASNDGTRAGYLIPSVKISSANPAFADMNGLIKMAQDKGFRSDTTFEGFLHQGEIAMEERPDYGLVSMKFDKNAYRVDYLYDKATNSYKREQKGVESVDFATNETFAPKNLIGIVTKRDTWLTDHDYVAEGLLDPWLGVDEEHRKNDNAQYPNMQLGDPWFDTQFEGEARFFMNGKDIQGTWKRVKGEGTKFEFYDEAGAEIAFVPGQIWMHVLPHGEKVSYETAKERDERLAEEAAAPAGLAQ